MVTYGDGDELSSMGMAVVAKDVDIESCARCERKREREMGKSLSMFPLLCIVCSARHRLCHSLSSKSANLRSRKLIASSTTHVCTSIIINEARDSFTYGMRSAGSTGRAWARRGSYCWPAAAADTWRSGKVRARRSSGRARTGRAWQSSRRSHTPGRPTCTMLMMTVREEW